MGLLTKGYGGDLVVRRVLGLSLLQQSFQENLPFYIFFGVSVLTKCLEDKNNLSYAALLDNKLSLLVYFYFKWIIGNVYSILGYLHKPEFQYI